jgi:hypothetical protein
LFHASQLFGQPLVGDSWIHGDLVEHFINFIHQTSIKLVVRGRNTIREISSNLSQHQTITP